MADLPIPNPIDSGLLPRGGAVDHLGGTTIECFACGGEEQAERYRMIFGGHFGFGSHAFVKPFLKRSSTKGKLGRRGTYAMCCKCHSLYPQDEGAEESLVRAGFSIDGIIPEHMHYEVLNRVAEELEASEATPEQVGLPSSSRVHKLEADVPPTPELEGTTMSELPENSRVRKLDAEVSSEPEAQESEVVEPLEPEVQESEVVEPPEGTKVRDVEPEPAVEPVQDPGGQLGTDIDDDPEIRRLLEDLAAAETEAEQLAEERAAEEAIREREEAKRRRIKELNQKLIEAKSEIASLRDSDVKVHRRTCTNCRLSVVMPCDSCPGCGSDISIQQHGLEHYRCGKCDQVAGKDDVSCSFCGAEYANCPPSPEGGGGRL